MQRLLDREELLIAELPGVVVLLMRRSPDDAAFADATAQIRDVLTRQQRINVVILIPRFDGATRARHETQRAFGQMLGDLRERLVSTAIVIAVPGLKGAMLRMIVNTALMLSRMRSPIQIHASVGTAVTWLREVGDQVPEVKGAPFLEPDLTRLLSA